MISRRRFDKSNCISFVVSQQSAPGPPQKSCLARSHRTTEIIMPRGQVVERNLRDRFRDNDGLDPRRAFSFIFGNINGWLACRFCGTWHLVADGSFSSEQLQVELADRHCTLPQWSRPHDRRAAITAGSAPLTPTAEACEQHRAHLGAYRLALLDRHGGEEAEDWVPAEALLAAVGRS